MKKLLYILNLLLAVILSGSCFSQQIIATAGGNSSLPGFSLDWTIGEPVTTTTHGSGFVLTQGFHQGQPVVESFNHQISVSPGWNLISMNVMPNNNNLTDVFQSLIDLKTLKKVMDETGLTLEDWGIYGGWKNGIGKLTSTEGYKINVNSATTFSVEGTTFLFPFNIWLKNGWNIISWPALNEQDGIAVFQSLINKNQLKKVMNESGMTIEDWGVYGGWKNGIGNLKPGEGYKVYVTSDCYLTINGSGIKSDKIEFAQQLSSHFVPVYKGNGTEHMNINLVNLFESGIQEGDEIGIFDSDICVGSTIISKTFIDENQIGIPVSMDDISEIKNGFSNGNTITSKLFRNGIELPLNIIAMNNQSNQFESGSSLFATVNSELSTKIETKLENHILNCFPNPFSQELTIELNLAKESEVSVEVLNQLGQIVQFLAADKIYPNGSCRIFWNGKNAANQTVAPGIYHIKINIDGESYHRKVVSTALQ